MSENHNHRLKVVAAVAVFGLTIGLLASRADAQLLLTNANYAGRYVCQATGDAANNTYTEVIRYGPNGGGAYNSGT